MTAAEAAAELEAAARAGLLTYDDLETFAAALKRAGYIVQLPPRPTNLGRVGWLEARVRPCRKQGCPCETTGDRRHRVYVYHCWREGKVRKAKYLGRLGVTRMPEDVRAAFKSELERLEAGFLHDD